MMSRPSIREMLEFVEATEGTLLDPYYRKPLARWDRTHTRIVVNGKQPKAAQEHVLSFLALYRHEKIIGISVGSLPRRKRKKKR